MDQRRGALVLASSGGLGGGCARALADAGNGVTIFSRSAQRLQTLARQISDEGGSVLVERGDVASESDIARAVQSTIAEFGQLAVLVVNAPGPPPGRFVDLTLDQWDASWTGTMRSAIVAIKQCVPHMLEHGYGRIVIIGSSSVRRPLPNLMLSNAFRPGLNGLVKALAVEVAHRGVTVNMACPGRIQTPRVDAIDQVAADRDGVSPDEIRRLSVAQIPAGRYGTIAEFAALVAFLASDEASYISGQTVLADGGLATTLP